MSSNDEENECEDVKEFPPIPQDGVPYDKGWAWFIVAGSFLMHALVVGFNKSFGILFVEFQSIFDLTSASTSWIAAIMMTSLNLGSLVGTTLSDHFTSRRIVMIGGVLMGSALVLSSFMDQIKYIYISIGLIFGIGCSFSYGPSIIMVPYYFHNRMALANAVSVSGSGIGAFILPPLVTALIDAYSLKGALIILGALMFHMCIAGSLFRPTSFYSDKYVTNTEIENGEALLANGGDNKTVRTQNGIQTANGRLTLCARCLTYHRTDLKTSECVTNADQRFHASCDEMISRKTPKNLGNRRVSLSHNELYRIPKPRETFIYSSYTDLVLSTSTFSVPVLLHAETDNIDGKSSCLACRRKTKILISNLFDFSLFKSPVFVLLALGCTLQNFGYVGQFRFFPARMKDLGIPQMQRALLLSIMGGMDICSRLVIGFLADYPFVKLKIKRYRILASAILLLGLCGILCPLATTFRTNIIYAVSLGVCGGVNQAMMGVSVMDLLGREMVSKAWGLILLLYGLTNMGEPMILGALRDSTGNYDWTFRTCGLSIIAGSLLIFCEHFALNRRKRIKALVDNC